MRESYPSHWSLSDHPSMPLPLRKQNTNSGRQISKRKKHRPLFGFCFHWKDSMDGAQLVLASLSHSRPTNSVFNDTVGRHVSGSDWSAVRGTAVSYKPDNTKTAAWWGKEICWLLYFCIGLACQRNRNPSHRPWPMQWRNPVSNRETDNISFLYWVSRFLTGFHCMEMDDRSLCSTFSSRPALAWTPTSSIK